MSVRTRESIKAGLTTAITLVLRHLFARTIGDVIVIVPFSI